MTTATATTTAILDRINGINRINGITANDDGNGNCWSAPPAPPAASALPAPDEKPLVAELLKLRSSPDYARLSPSCRQRYDELERALRQRPADAAPTDAGAMAPLLEWLQECGAAPAPR